MGTLDGWLVRVALAEMSGPVVRLGLVAALAGCATNPVTGKSELSLVSESQEIQMGQQAAAEVRQSSGVVNDPALAEYVRRVGLEIAKQTERPNLPWSFDVVDDPAVNAFALPGGPIFVTRGILGHMESEAELAAVLGHEIGHVTARHSVQQISRQQIAQGLLGIGSILSSDVAAVAGIASQGLGLLFLKYSRDAESQADELGFRYALKDGYDVRAMRSMFEMLERVSATGGSGKLPQWLSTHPDPENRIVKTDQRLAAVTVDLSKAKTNRDQFIQHLDGLTFGDDPRQGFFEGSRFNHPDMAFRLDFPQGWTTQNQASAVIAVSQGQDAMVALSLAGKDDPATSLGKFLGQQGIQAGATSAAPINAFPAAAGEFQAQTQNGVVAGRIAFLAYGGSTFQLLGYAPAQSYPTYRAVIDQTIRSFNRLTDPAALARQPARIKLVRLSRDMTVDQFNRQYPSVVPVATVAIINGVGAATDVLKGGSWAKRVQ